MKINWKVRFKNPLFYAQLILSIFVPVLAYMGISFPDLTTWEQVGNVLLLAAQNPFVLATVIVSVYNAVVDPTTQGIGDSFKALQYRKPK